ncbi:hypothetical protein GARC_4620 [Paraglaciecola arctica BSs20135]|uniref:Uncharacterized protein n=1 Tax=Paraglaciecola arctica BSs20135 TaxID=493475 RepID=K6YTR3_9ALTE|nr:hypothetical protein GARC_4620 [Paraglaciecola arctica BSs20135]
MGIIPMPLHFVELTISGNLKFEWRKQSIFQLFKNFNFKIPSKLKIAFPQ